MHLCNVLWKPAGNGRRISTWLNTGLCLLEKDGLPQGLERVVVSIVWLPVKLFSQSI